MPVKSFTLGEIAAHISGEVIGDPAVTVSGPAPFEVAQTDQITFAAQPKYLKKLDATTAGAVIVPKHISEGPTHLIQVANPFAAFARVAGLFYPPDLPPFGISARAHIGSGFQCGERISVGHGVIIMDNVTIGERSVLHPGVYIGAGAVIGDDVVLHPNVVVGAGSCIGNRVVIQAGSVIGSDGFGFAPDGDVYIKIPHTGIVRIDDDVEIGANNTIDRATMGETHIKRGVKTDNLVHIAHNVVVGENTVLVAQVGIAGSTSIGRNAVLAGQVGVSGHLSVGDRVTIGPQAGIAQSITEGQTISGTPGMPHRIWLRVQRILPMLPDLRKRIQAFERRLQQLEEERKA